VWLVQRATEQADLRGGSRAWCASTVAPQTTAWRSGALLLTLTLRQGLTSPVFTTDGAPDETVGGMTVREAVRGDDPA